MPLVLTDEQREKIESSASIAVEVKLAAPLLKVVAALEQAYLAAQGAQ